MTKKAAKKSKRPTKKERDMAAGLLCKTCAKRGAKIRIENDTHARLVAIRDYYGFKCLHHAVDFVLAPLVAAYDGGGVKAARKYLNDRR